MSGFIALHREAFDHPVLRDGERFRAWFWLVSNACWKQSRVEVGGAIITLERGQLCYSIRYLAEAWKWPKSNVDRFLKRLEAELMVTLTRSRHGTNGGTAQIVVTICNYERYQGPSDLGGTSDGTAAGQQRDSSGTNKNKGNKGTIEEDTDVSPSTVRTRSADAFPQPDFADDDVWADFLKNRKAKRLSNTATAYRKFLKDIHALVDPQWPPGRLLEEIVARGWGAAFDPRPKDYRNGNRNDQAHWSPSSGDRDNRDGYARALDKRIERAQSGQTAEGVGRSDLGAGDALGELPLARVRELR